MKKPPVLLAFGGAVALASALLLPQRSIGQAANGVDPILSQLVNEVIAQQVVIAENHARIDENLAAIAEDVRVGRIYVSRGGGKMK